MFLGDQPFISRPPPPGPERKTWEEIKVEIVFRKMAREKVSSLEVVCIDGSVESVVAAAVMDAG